MFGPEYYKGMFAQRLLDDANDLMKGRAPTYTPIPQVITKHRTKIVEVEKPLPPPPPPGIHPGYFESIQANDVYDAYVFPLSIVSRHLLDAKYIEPKLGKFETIASDSLLKSQANFFNTLDAAGMEALSLVTSSDLKYMQNFFAYLNKSNDLIYSSALNATKSTFRTNDQRALLDQDLLETKLLLSDKAS